MRVPAGADVLPDDAHADGGDAGGGSCVGASDRSQRIRTLKQDAGAGGAGAREGLAAGREPGVGRAFLRSQPRGATRCKDLVTATPHRAGGIAGGNSVRCERCSREGAYLGLDSPSCGVASCVLALHRLLAARHRVGDLHSLVPAALRKIPDQLAHHAPPAAPMRPVRARRCSSRRARHQRQMMGTVHQPAPPYLGILIFQGYEILFAVTPS